MCKEVKQIGLDRVTLTVKDNEIEYHGTNENGLYQVKVKEDGIVIRPNNLNKDKTDINITVPKVFNATNERNVTQEDFEYIVPMIEDILLHEKVFLDVGESNLGSFEINYNVNNQKLYDCLMLVCKAIINNGHKVYKVENKNGIQSIKIKKARHIIKIYKKSEHLQEIGQEAIEDYVVRFEVSTNVLDEKKRLLGDDITLNGLIHQWQDVEDWFKSCIKNSIKKPVNKYLKQLEDECLERLNQGVKPSQVVNDLMFKSDLIDLSVFDNAIKRHYKATGKKRPQSVIKSTHARLKKLNPKRYQEVTGNVEELEKFYKLLEI